MPRYCCSNSFPDITQCTGAWCAPIPLLLSIYQYNLLLLLRVKFFLPILNVLQYKIWLRIVEVLNNFSWFFWHFPFCIWALTHPKREIRLSSPSCFLIILYLPTLLVRPNIGIKVFGSSWWFPQIFLVCTKFVKLFIKSESPHQKISKKNWMKESYILKLTIWDEVLIIWVRAVKTLLIWQR